MANPVNIGLNGGKKGNPTDANIQQVLFPLVEINAYLRYVNGLKLKERQKYFIYIFWNALIDVVNSMF